MPVHALPALALEGSRVLIRRYPPFRVSIPWERSRGQQRACGRQLLLTCAGPGRPATRSGSSPTCPRALQVRCGSALRVWRCGVSVWCYRLAGRPEREAVRNARQRASACSQPASNLYCGTVLLVLGTVTPAFDQPHTPCPAVANWLLSAGVWESAAPRGTSPTCLHTVPSHTSAPFPRLPAVP